MDAYNGPNNETVANYLAQCISKLEAMDAESITDVLNPFIQRYVNGINVQRMTDLLQGRVFRGV